MNLEKSKTDLTNMSNSNMVKPTETFIKEPTAEESQIVSTILTGINIKDTSAIIKFGTEAQQEISNFTDTVLNTVKTKDLSGAGENLEKMIEEMQSINFSSVKASDGFLANLPVIGSWVKKGIKTFVGDTETVTQKVTGMLTILDGQEKVLSDDIKMLDNLYETNFKFVRNLELFILAGTEKLVELKKEVEELKAIAVQSSDAFDTQQYSDMDKSCERFEKRISNLKISRITAIQAAAQIRLAQESDKMIVEDIIDITFNTVPMWKRQFVMATSLARQEKALNISKTVKDYTNKQYKDNAEKMNQLVNQVSDSFSRGILDISVMEEVNQLTITSIKKSLTIHKDAKIKREEANKKLIIMEQNMKTALLDAAKSV